MIEYNNLFKVLPGLVLCCVIAVLIVVVTERFPNAILDPLLIALLSGIAFKSIFPEVHWHNEGAKFSGKYILELSVMVLGASIFLPDIVGAGLWLFVLILVGVAGSMLIAFFVGHIMLKLSLKHAILIGVSNSICGNSAAAVMAPIIGASSVELSSVIAISGLLGAAQIILLPLLVPVFGLSDYHYGIVAGMAVYAVAQVYAASATVSATSASVATFVKLSRVVLLAPLVVVVQMLMTFSNDYSSAKLNGLNRSRVLKNIPIHQYLPWFVLGFMILATLRSFEIIDETNGNIVREFSRYSFLVAMLAIGMGVDIRDVLKIGPKVILVIFSVLIFMITISMLAGSHIALS